MTEITHIAIPDDVVANMHTKQLLTELERRLAGPHFKVMGQDVNFTKLEMLIPTKVWRGR